MDAALGMLAGLGSLAVLLVMFGLLARRVRRSGAGARLMGPIDEVFHPGAHRSRVEIQVQDERAAPPAAPGDPLRPPVPSADAPER